MTVLSHDEKSYKATGVATNEVTFTHGFQDGNWVLTKGDIKRVQHLLFSAKSRLANISDEEVGALWMKQYGKANGTHDSFENHEEFARKLLKF